MGKTQSTECFVQCIPIQSRQENLRRQFFSVAPDIPLIRAIQDENFQKIKKLLRKGHDLNKIDDLSRTPIYYAVVIQNINIINFFIHNCASLRFRDNVYKSPLHYAMETKNEDSVLLLLQHGAAEHLSGMEKQCLLCSAVTDKLKKVVPVLSQKIESLNFSIPNIPLCIAARENDLEMAQILLDSGADANYRICCKEPLKEAFNCQNEEMVNLLLLNGLKDYDFHSNRFQEVLATHAIKMQLLGSNENSYVNYLQYCKQASAKSTSFIEKFRVKCAKELDILKRTEISRRHFLTYYDFLTLSENQVAFFVKVVCIRKKMLDMEYEKQFPIFSSMLEHRWNKCNKKRRLLDKGQELIREFLYRKKVLPEDCIVKILSYFTVRDLEKIVKYTEFCNDCFSYKYIF